MVSPNQVLFYTFNPMNFKILLCLFAGYFSSSKSITTNYFVDAVNGLDTRNGLTLPLAKQSIAAAANLTVPGYNLFVARNRQPMGWGGV